MSHRADEAVVTTKDQVETSGNNLATKPGGILGTKPEAVGANIPRRLGGNADTDRRRIPRGGKSQRQSVSCWSLVMNPRVDEAVVTAKD